MRNLTEQQEKQQKTKLSLLGYNLDELNNLDTFNLLDQFQTLIFLIEMEEKDRKEIINYSDSEEMQKNINLINAIKLRLIKSITNI
jgi:hypothetical protein